MATCTACASYAVAPTAITSASLKSSVGQTGLIVPRKTILPGLAVLPAQRRRQQNLAARPGSTVALFGGEKKKFITKEEEPDEYWVSEREKEGKSVMSDPIAIIGVVAIAFPFIALGIAFAAGLIKLPN